MENKKFENTKKNKYKSELKKKKERKMAEGEETSEHILNS